MSIIYDALQKTQRSREYLSLQNALMPHRTPKHPIKWVILAIFILFLSAALGGFMAFYWSTAWTAAQAAKPVKPVVKVKQAIANPRPVPKPAPAVLRAEPIQTANLPAPKPQPPLPVPNVSLDLSKLKLNGVMISGSERIVLINNQTFHVGDVIDGMKIINIEFNAIKLQKDQQVVELKVPV